MLGQRVTIQPLNVILGFLVLLPLVLYSSRQSAKLAPQGGEDVYWLCTDLPEFTIPDTGISVHTPKDGETMNVACRDMDKDFFQVIEKVAGGWVHESDPQEKKALGFMRWLNLELPRDLAYQIKSTAFMPNLVMVTIVAINQSATE